MNSPDELFYATQSEVIAKNEGNASMWSAYKEDLKGTQTLLKQLPEQLSHNVMVPLGSKAMMRGKITHTNEFLVSLGDSYFVKRTANQSWDICERRIQRCDEMLQNLERERNLFDSKLTLPNKHEAFGTQDRPEIVEFVTEEEDNEWRKIHREREKEYRKKLAESREKKKTKIETEEDLWQRLDELELEEELEDELQRLHQEYSTEEEEEDNDESEEEVVTETLEENTVVSKTEVESSKENIEVKPRRKSVVFAEDIKQDETETPLYLNFKHSEVTPTESTSAETVESPRDIYPKYLQELREAPPSILKVRKNPNKVKELANISEGDESDSDREAILVQRGLELPDVSERRYFEVETVGDVAEKPKRISKFKASRLKNVTSH